MPRNRVSREPIRAIRAASQEIKGCEDLVAQAQAGSKSARDQIILRFLPWIQAQARLYAKRCGRHDLVQDMQQSAICGDGESTAGLMRAIEKYDPSRNRAFDTYAIYWVNAALLHCVGANTRIAWNADAIGRVLRIQQIAGDLRSYLGREPTCDEIRAAAHTTQARWNDRRIQEALADNVALEPRHPEGEPSIATNAQRRELAVDEGKQPEFRADVLHLLPALSEEQQTLLHAYFGEGYTQKEIAQMRGVSMQRAGQLINKALEQLAKVAAAS